MSDLIYVKTGISDDRRAKLNTVLCKHVTRVKSPLCALASSPAAFECQLSCHASMIATTAQLDGLKGQLEA